MNNLKIAALCAAWLTCLTPAAKAELPNFDMWEEIRVCEKHGEAHCAGQVAGIWTAHVLTVLKYRDLTPAESCLNKLSRHELYRAAVHWLRANASVETGAKGTFPVAVFALFDTDLAIENMCQEHNK